MYNSIFSLLLISMPVGIANAEQPPKPTISVESVVVQKGEDIFVKINVSSEVDTDKISEVTYVEARIAQTENTYTNNRDFVYVDMIKTDIPETQIEVVGDVNRDGKFSEDDVMALCNYLVKNEVEIDTAATDVNSDGKLNGKDVVLLGRLVINM